MREDQLEQALTATKAPETPKLHEAYDRNRETLDRLEKANSLLWSFYGDLTGEPNPSNMVEDAAKSDSVGLLERHRRMSVDLMEATSRQEEILSLIVDSIVA